MRSLQDAIARQANGLRARPPQVEAATGVDRAKMTAELPATSRLDDVWRLRPARLGGDREQLWEHGSQRR